MLNSKRWGKVPRGLQFGAAVAAVREVVLVGAEHRVDGVPLSINKVEREAVLVGANLQGRSARQQADRGAVVGAVGAVDVRLIGVGDDAGHGPSSFSSEEGKS